MSRGHCVTDVRVGSADVALDAATRPEAAVAAVQDAGYGAAVARTTATETAEI